jgi:hypothetical protein
VSKRSISSAHCATCRPRNILVVLSLSAISCNSNMMPDNFSSLSAISSSLAVVRLSVSFGAHFRLREVSQIVDSIVHIRIATHPFTPQTFTIQSR